MITFGLSAFWGHRLVVDDLSAQEPSFNQEILVNPSSEMINAENQTSPTQPFFPQDTSIPQAIEAQPAYPTPPLEQPPISYPQEYPSQLFNTGYPSIENLNTDSSSVNNQPSGPSKANLVMKNEKTKQKSKNDRGLAEHEKIMIDVLELKNMDIIDVLKLIAQKSGLNIVAGRDVSGRVSLYVKDVEIRDALNLMAEMNNLAFVQEGGVIKFMSDKEYQLKYGRRFAEKFETQTVQLVNMDALEVSNVLNQMKSVIGRVIPERNSNSVVIMDVPEKVEELVRFLQTVDAPRKNIVWELTHANAEEVSKKLTEVLTKNVGKVEVDIRSNRLLVTELETKIPRIQKFIDAMDVKQKEVLIEAKIVQVVLSDQYKMGVDWEGIVRGWHQLDFKSNFSVLDSSDKRGRVSIGTVENDDYTALIEAIKSIGTTNLLSSPRITVINNKEAKILVGSTEPYITSTTITPSSGPTTTSEAVNFIEVGVKLYVTPTIHNDGYVTMQIKPEVSSVTKTVKTSNNNTIPVVETSQAETTVIVRDGATIVIGGLIKDEKIKTTRKVPLFGDVPIVGAAFRSREDVMRKTELVIFLTPRVVTGDRLGKSEDLIQDPCLSADATPQDCSPLKDFIHTQEHLGQKSLDPWDEEILTSSPGL